MQEGKGQLSSSRQRRGRRIHKRHVDRKVPTNISGPKSTNAQPAAPRTSAAMKPIAGDCNRGAHGAIVREEGTGPAGAARPPARGRSRPAEQAPGRGVLVKTTTWKRRTRSSVSAGSVSGIEAV